MYSSNDRATILTLLGEMFAGKAGLEDALKFAENRIAKRHGRGRAYPFSSERQNARYRRQFARDVANRGAEFDRLYADLLNKR